MSEKSFIQHDVGNKQLKEENTKLRKENDFLEVEMRNGKLETRNEKLEMTNGNKQFKEITYLKKNQKR